MQKIVLGYDETDASKRALERVAQLAKAFGSEVFVSSVAPLISSAARSGGPIDPADPPSKHVEELSHARAYLRVRESPRATRPQSGVRRTRSWRRPRRTVRI